MSDLEGDVACESVRALVRLPGLFKRCELRPFDCIDDFRVEAAGTSPEGCALVAIYCHDTADRELTERSR